MSFNQFYKLASIFYAIIDLFGGFNKAYFIISVSLPPLF